MCVPPGCYSLAQQAAESHASFVQLRFRRAHCASKHLTNLLVLIPFYIVQDEHHAITVWQLSDRLFQRNAINHGHLAWVLGSAHSSSRSFAIVCRSFRLYEGLAKV